MRPIRSCLCSIEAFYGTLGFNFLIIPNLKSALYMDDVNLSMDSSIGDFLSSDDSSNPPHAHQTEHTATQQNMAQLTSSYQDMQLDQLFFN